MSLKVVQSSLIRQVKSIGASVAAPPLRGEVIKWIQSCSSSPSTSTSSQMNDLNVILFDSHTDALAKELLERNVKNLFLLEGSQQNADKQKEAVEDLEDQYPDSNISALYASMKNILCPSKIAKINIPLWQKFFDREEPQKKYKNYVSPEKEKNNIVMFGCLPFPTQQRALLQSLLEQLLIHYDISTELTKKTKVVDSYFQFGSFSLITFLHASHLTRLFSSPLDSLELQFYGRSHRTFSHLFNTLFDVQKLSSSSTDGYDLSMFHPQIPLSPIKAYLKPLQQLGYEENKFYPVKIVPRSFISLPGMGDDDEISFKLEKYKRDENNVNMNKRRKQIINYAWWILMTGKTPKQLKEIWETVGLSSQTSGIPPPKSIKEFSMYFPQISDRLEKQFSAELKSFRASLYKDKTDEKVVD